MFRAAGKQRVKWMTDICNEVTRSGKVPVDCRIEQSYNTLQTILQSTGTTTCNFIARHSHTILPVYKGQGDQMPCGKRRVG